MVDNRTENPFGAWSFGDAPFGPRPQDQPGAASGAVRVELHGKHDEIIALAARHNETIQLHALHDENIAVAARHNEAPYMHGKHKETISIGVAV